MLEVTDFHDLARHHGPTFGDEILIAVARRLEHAARPGDPLARLDSDEFVLVLPTLQGRPRQSRRRRAPAGPARSAVAR